MLTIYKASAGSGKTYTLAFQYIKILLAYFEPKDTDQGIFFDEEGPTFNPDGEVGGENVTQTEMAHNEAGRQDGNPSDQTQGEGQTEGQTYQGRWRLYGPKGPRSRHRNILAVTFTHKATEEMKNRIIKELRLIVSTAEADESERSDYARKLIDLTGCTPHELKESAKRALDDLLYDFHFFNVSTIDSFFQQVLRGFAREVAKNEDFALEIDNNVAVTMGVDSMLNSINTEVNQQNESLSNYLYQWMRSEYSVGRIGNMFNRNTGLYRKLISFVESTMSEEFKVHSDEVLDYLRNDPERFIRFRNAIFDRYNQIPEQAKTLATEALNLYNSSSELVKKNLNGNLLKALNKLAGLSNEPFNWDKCSWGQNPPKYIEAALTNPIGMFNAGYRDKNTQPPQPLSDTIAQAIKAVITGYQQLKWLNAIKSVLSHFGVLVSALDYIMRYRQDNNLILLSDTNELLKKVINDQDAPFIYEKLGNILEYYLIDEFQDTSGLQWDNLRPLVQNSIAQGKEDLIIGDEKQSIYRFRNADAELLHYKAQQDIGQGNYLVRGDRPGENTNYRSAPAVVRFNNTVFSYLGRKIETLYFNNVVQDIPQKNRNKRGHVRFDVIPADTKAAYGDMVLPRLVADIRSLKQRGYKNGDIAILVRTRQDGNNIVDYLLQQNDPDIVVASDESLMLTMSPSVRVIISTLRMFTQHRDPDPGNKYDNDLEMRINEVEFINSTEGDISHSVERVVEGNKKEELKQLETVADYRSSNLFTLTERIIQDVLTPEMRQRDYSYIMAFQDYVSKFCAQFTSNVRKFLRWWDTNEKKLTVAASPNAEAIRVMTIHKSKGLEFKCVLIPFTAIDVKAREELWVSGDRIKGIPELNVDDDDIPPMLRIQGSSSLDDKDCPFYEDYQKWRKNQKTDVLNVGYVAFTRAENELIGYIKGKPPKTTESSSSSSSSSSSKTKKPKSKAEDVDDSTKESNSDLINIGGLLEEAFQKVDTLEFGNANGDINPNGNGGEDPEAAAEQISADGAVKAIDVDRDDELYYCTNPGEEIPLKIPLKPYFRQVEFSCAEEYTGLMAKSGNGSGYESDTENTEDSATVGTSGDANADSDVNEEVNPTEQPFVIGRFEYGEPTVAPALELTEQEKEERLRREMENQEKEHQDEDRFRSPLEKISLTEYTPTFPKTVEHYFTVDQEQETFEEEDLASDIADAPSEEEALPGGFDPQLWGEILHRAMSYIHDKGDAERAIARVSRQYQMDDASYDYLCRRVWETIDFDHPMVRLWFDRHRYESVVTERPIYEPTTLATYRPDRIVWYDDGSADIIDYKFGTLFSSEYDLQMKKYIELIDYMGAPRVRGFIYFPNSKTIKEIRR